MSTTLETATNPITWIVSFKTNWSDSWSTDEWLMPESVQFALAPTMPVATIIRDFGIMQKLSIGAGSSSSTEPIPFDLKGNYIKIELAQEGTEGLLWYGYCPAVADDYAGVREEAGSTVNTGRTTYSVYGLEWFLKDTKILQTSAEKVGGGSQIINATLPFNFVSRKRVWELQGNRSDAVDGDGIYYFAERDPTADPPSESGEQEWTGETVLDHLLFHWGQQTGEKLEWDVSGGIELENVFNAWDFAGTDYYSAISTLINPAFGFVWFVDVNPGSGNPRINIKAAVEDDIRDENGTVIVTGQGTTLNFNISTDTRVSRCLIKHIENATYDKISVRGAPVRTCFTVGLNSGVLTDSIMEKGWTSAQEDAYKSADDDSRVLDDYSSVYSRFEMKNDWNGNSNSQKALPAVDPDTGMFADSPTAGKVYYRNKVFDRTLPWPEIDNDSQLRRPFGVFQDADEKWHMIDRPRNDTDSTEFAPVSLAMLDDKLGVELRTGSKQNHIVAKGSFTEPSSDKPQWDYKKTLFTVSMYSDDISRVDLDTINGEAGENDREKVILMPWCEVWYIVPGTVKTIDPSVAGSAGLTKQEEGEYTRDDTEKLQRAARLARVWYGETRQIMDLTYGAPDISDLYELGSIVEDLDRGEVTEKINTILSEFTYRLREKEQSLTIKTSFRDIDIARMLRPLSGGSGGSRRFQPSPMHDELANIPVRQAASAPGAAATGQFIITAKPDDKMDISVGHVINGTQVTTVDLEEDFSVAGANFLSLEIWYDGSWKTGYKKSGSYPDQAKKSGDWTVRVLIAEKVGGSWQQRWNQEFHNTRSVKD